MHLSILAGTTSKIVQIPVYDSSSTTGGMLTGLAFNTASLVCWYNREGAAGSANQISLLTATKGTWTTAGFVAVDGTNMPGWYELHVPNAAIAAGAKSVSIEMRGAANMVPVNILIELTATDNQDAVRGGMTALPNAAAAASGGLVVLGTNATAISFTAGMTISSTTGNALALTSSGGNGDGLAATGNGTGAGIHLVPGATGNGLLAVGGATSGSAIKATGTAGNAIALELAGQGSAAGLSATGGATGIGITAVGGATSGSGLKVAGTAGNAIALEIAGQGSAAGIQATGGATGSAFKLVGGATSGHGLAVTTTAGDGFNLTPTAGNAITATANGTSKHGIVATGGTAGTSDGASFVAGTGGVDFRAAQTGAVIGNITGSLSGSVGSVTGAVGSVTGAVGSVTGAVGSVTGNVGGNVVGSTASVTGAVGSVTGNVGGNVTGSVGSVTAAVSLSTSDSPVVQSGTAQAGGASTITLSGSASATDNLYNGQTVKTIAGTGPAQVRVITGYVGSTKVATVDRAWATNPDITTTYAVLATDLAKTNSSLEVVSASVTGAVGSVTGSVGSVTGAVGSVTGAVGSVAGNVGGNVVGSVASVTARVTANADQWAGTTIPAPTVTGVPKVDLVDIAGAAVSTTTAQLGVNAVQIGASAPGSATIGTVTNLTTNNDKTGYALSVTPPTAVQVRQEMDSNSTKLANLDATISSRSTYAGGAVASVTAPVSLSSNDSPVVQSGTAQGGAGSTITLSAGASATDNIYNGQTVKTTGGAGPSQVRVILSYVGSTKIATVDRAWATNPDATTTYAVLATDQAKTNSSLEVVAASVTGAVGSVTGSVGSVSGAVASVTGNVGGNVVGSVASVTADVGITQAGADKVWSTTTRALTDKIGFALSSAGVQAIWDALTSALTTVGSIGKLLVTNLDATVSSRSTYAGGDTSGVTTLLGRLTSTRATNLDNLDATVSSRSTFAGGAVASVTASVTVGTNNDKTGYRLSATGIDDVWDEATSGHTTAGTTGKALIDAGSAGDPWSTALPGAYGSGTAGSILGTNLDATVSSRSTYAGADTGGTTTLLGRLTSTRAGLLDNLDAAVSTRSSHSAADVWAVGTRTLTAFTIAVDITSAAASLIWDKLLTGITTASSIGKLIKDNLDAAVSTRSTYAGGDTSGTTTLLGRLTSTRAGNLDNLDAAISTRSTYAGADTSGTTTLLGRLTSGRSVNLDNLDIAVSTRSSHTAADVWAVTTRTLSGFGTLVSDTTTAVWGAASRTLTAFGFSVTAATVSDKTGYSLTTAYDLAKTASQPGDAMTLTGAYDAAKTALPSSSYAAPDNTSIVAIKAKTDNLPAAPAATADIPTANQNADALLKRDWTAVTGEAARSVLNALRFMRNKWSISGTTMTVTKEDDATSAWTATISTNASQNPVSGADPS